MKVNEIFYTLQGEGFHTGTPAVFVRLAGCNLSCPFCDTDFGSGTEMSEGEIVSAVVEYPVSWVVITGGEPALQLTATLVDSLHQHSKRVALETNGTVEPPSNVDWITLSPKDIFLGKEASPVLAEVDELKVVYDGIHQPDLYPQIKVRHARFLQPCDMGNQQCNELIINKTIDYIKTNPQWRLSLQIHKMIGIK